MDLAGNAISALRDLLNVLGSVGITSVALTGGVAFSYWVTPRHTDDFDLCGIVPQAAVEKLLSRYDGIRSGPERLPARIRFSVSDWSVDLL